MVMKQKQMFGIATLLVLLFPSCVKDDNLFVFDEDEMMEIAESEVFHNYLLAKFDAKEQILHADKYFNLGYCASLGDSICYIPQSIIDDYVNKKEQLIRKFPKFEKLSSDDIFEVHCMALSVTPSLSKHLGEDRKLFVRTRAGNNPEIAATVANNDPEILKAKRLGKYRIQAFVDFADAFLAAREWGHSHEEYGYDSYGHFHILRAKEIGGFVFDDASALEELDLSARNQMVIEYYDSGNIKSIKTEAGYARPQTHRENIIMHYHYHPNLNNIFSGLDISTMLTYSSVFPNYGCEVIITDKEIVWRSI